MYLIAQSITLEPSIQVSTSSADNETKKVPPEHTYKCVIYLEEKYPDLYVVVNLTHFLKSQ